MTATHGKQPTARRRGPAVWMIAAAVIGWFMTGVGPNWLEPRVQAFDWDVHYAWTYYLAVEVGFTPREAFQIASATQSIDVDPDTGPMEAMPADAIIGARDPGVMGAGANDRIADIWLNFHAFRREGVSVQDHLDTLYPAIMAKHWATALLQRNMGPYLHFLQDIFAHGAYDDVRGHAFAGHAPDFLDFDKDRATPEMTQATLAALERFMREIMKRKPRAYNWSRIHRTMVDVTAVNPLTLQAANWSMGGPSGRPSLVRAMDVVNDALKTEWGPERDAFAKRGGRISDSYFDVPPKALEYGFDESGRCAAANYAVEDPKLLLDRSDVTVTGSTGARLTYTIGGFTKLPRPTPPVVESFSVGEGGDSREVRRPATRDNGTFTSGLETTEGPGDLYRLVVFVKARPTATAASAPYAGARVVGGSVTAVTDTSGRAVLRVAGPAALTLSAEPRADDARHETARAIGQPGRATSAPWMTRIEIFGVGTATRDSPSMPSGGSEQSVEIELTYKAPPPPFIGPMLPPARPPTPNRPLDRPAYIFVVGPPEGRPPTYFLRTGIPAVDSSGAYLFGDGTGGVFHQQAEYSGPFSDTNSLCAAMRGIGTTLLLYGNGPDYVDCDKNGPSVPWKPGRSGGPSAASTPATSGVVDLASASGPTTFTSASGVPVTIVSGNRLPPGSVITTGPGGVVELRTPGGSMIRFGEGSRGSVTDRTGGSSQVQLDEGRVDVIHAPGTPAVGVTTTDGEVTTTDTRYRVEKVDGGTEVTVFEGAVTLTGRAIYRLALPGQEIGKSSPAQTLTLRAPGRAIILRAGVSAPQESGSRPSYLPSTSAAPPTGAVGGTSGSTGGAPGATYLPSGSGVRASGAPTIAPPPPVTSPLSRPDPWNDAQVRALMSEWLSTARPASARPGQSWRYSDWGVVLAPGAVAAGPPDHPAGWDRFHTVWSIATRLTSQNICTLSEFVTRRIDGRDLAGCPLAPVPASVPTGPPVDITPSSLTAWTGDWTCQISDGRQQIAYTALHTDSAGRVTATLGAIKSARFDATGVLSFDLAVLSPKKHAPAPRVARVRFEQDTPPSLSSTIYRSTTHRLTLRIDGDRLTGESMMTDGRRLAVTCTRRPASVR